MACGPGTSPEIVGWETGARTGLHVRHGRITMLECRVNNTTHREQGEEEEEIFTSGNWRGERKEEEEEEEEENLIQNRTRARCDV